MYVTMNRSL